MIVSLLWTARAVAAKPPSTAPPAPDSPKSFPATKCTCANRYDGPPSTALDANRIAPKSFRPAHKPRVQLVFQDTHIRNQLVLKPFRIVHQISRMHSEKPCQQHPRRVRQMRPRPALDLRQIALADRLPELLLNRSRHVQLRQFPTQAPQGSFYFPQISQLLTQPHSASASFLFSLQYVI